jgi:hypothetical protein
MFFGMDTIFDMNISDLIFDKAIKEGVEKSGAVFPYEVTIVDTVPLTKIRLLSLMTLKHENLPPVRITPSGNIIDGRHRITTAIIRGEKSIKATYSIIRYCENIDCAKKMILSTNRSVNKELLCYTCYTEKCCKKCRVWCGEKLCDMCL